MRTKKNFKLIMFVVYCIVMAAPLAHGKKAMRSDTVFIAPFSSNAAHEYQWIGDAMAQALSTRLHLNNKLNYLSLRQVRATIKSNNIAAKELHSPKLAAKLGTLLGAKTGIVSSFHAAWPDITFIVRIIDIENAVVLHTINIDGRLNDLLQLEHDIAKALNKWGKLGSINTKRAVAGTNNLYAWRQLILGKKILWEQSLAPNKPHILPIEASRTALNHFEQALKLDPDYSQAQAEKVISLVLLHKPKQAVKALKAVNSSANNRVPEVILANYFIYWQLSQTTSGVKALQAVGTKSKQKALEQAIFILKQAEKKHPGFLLARGYLGELYQDLGQHKKALEHLQQYLKRIPKQPWVLAQMGYSYSKLDDHAKAIALSIEAVDLLPESPYLLLELASRYIDAKKYHGAEETLRKAIKIFPKFPTGYIRLGYLYLLRNKINLAVPISEKGLLLAQGAYQFKERAYANLNLTQAYYRKGKPKKAIKALKAAIDNGLSDASQLTENQHMKDFLSLPEVAKLLKDLEQ